MRSSLANDCVQRTGPAIQPTFGVRSVGWLLDILSNPKLEGQEDHFSGCLRQSRLFEGFEAHRVLACVLRILFGGRPRDRC